MVVFFVGYCYDRHYQQCTPAARVRARARIRARARVKDSDRVKVLLTADLEATRGDKSTPTLHHTYTYPYRSGGEQREERACRLLRNGGK